MSQEIKHWKNILINAQTTILSAMKHMDEESLRILIVIDSDQRLLGIITDGDIRRYLLKQLSLTDTVDKVMNKNPIVASLAENKDQLLKKMQSSAILHLPIVDEVNRVIGLETFEHLFVHHDRDNPVIFMAGGMGKRLHPLTLECPKPLIKIGNKPIAEILLENFIFCGFKYFIFSLNYKSDMMRTYFGNGSQWNITIEYIEEDNELGTAGSLSLLPSMPDRPFFVINADILTNIHFGHVLDFHTENQANHQATICVRQYQNIIPFGLIHMNENDHTLVHIEEKPVRNYFVNAGIYILEPIVLQQITFNTYCDMPNLLNRLVKQGYSISTFPIREYWIDIGHHDNLTQASSDYMEVFNR